MSSQGNQYILLRQAPKGVGYKLLELPPELVTLLESDDCPVLKLESSTNSAVLKTAEQTYALRQKNTSNNIILLSPSQQSSTSQIQEPSFDAIITLQETIELIPDTSKAAIAPAAKGKWHEKFGKSR